MSEPHSITLQAASKDQPLLPDAVAAIRSATQQLHDRLDRNLPLAQTAPTLADYAIHIGMLRDWQISLAPWLRRTSSSAASLQLIEQDLADCPAEIAALAQPATPDLRRLLQADDGSQAFCWGIAYVLEGSRLGGQVLYRRLSAPLAPHPLRYLSHRGERKAAGPSWPAMLASLRSELASMEAQAAACCGAVAAFEMLVGQFEQAQVLA